MGWISEHVPAAILDPVRVVLRAATGQPQLGTVDWGGLRRTRPIGKRFGADRGGAVDRFYIERFLDAERGAIRGRVLEIGENRYTRLFGGSRVGNSDVLDISPDNPHATIVADLADAPSIPDGTYDCVILTQVLQYLFRPEAGIATLQRILRPEGVLLLTVPGITQTEMNRYWGSTWYWSFTLQAVTRILRDAFGEGRIEVCTHGNVLAATAQLYGLGAAELTHAELIDADPDYQVIITGKAVKAGVG